MEDRTRRHGIVAAVAVNVVSEKLTHRIIFHVMILRCYQDLVYEPVSTPHKRQLLHVGRASWISVNCCMDDVVMAEIFSGTEISFFRPHSIIIVIVLGVVVML
jgi:hypothetical protein